MTADSPLQVLDVDGFTARLRVDILGSTERLANTVIEGLLASATARRELGRVATTVGTSLASVAADMPSRKLDVDVSPRPSSASSVEKKPRRLQTPQLSDELPLQSTTTVDVGRDRTDAEVTLSVDDPTGQSDFGMDVTFECTERSTVSRTVCNVARSTPNAEG